MLAFPGAWLAYNEFWIPAAIVLWTAIVTDVADGYIARKYHQTSALGGLLDHSSDAFFVTLLLLSLAALGIVTFVLPALVAAAFIQYTLDSRALSGHSLRSSQLGRYNGISYFVLAGFPVMQHAMQVTVIPENYFIWLSWGLVITTVISMTDRAVSLINR